MEYEKVCKNCEHFVQRSLDSGRYLGDCREPAKKEINGNKKGAFKWADDTCPDFKPKQRENNDGYKNGRSR